MSLSLRKHPFLIALRRWGRFARRKRRRARRNGCFRRLHVTVLQINKTSSPSYHWSPSLMLFWLRGTPKIIHFKIPLLSSQEWVGEVSQQQFLPVCKLGISKASTCLKLSGVLQLHNVFAQLYLINFVIFGNVCLTFFHQHVFLEKKYIY